MTRVQRAGETGADGTWARAALGRSRASWRVARVGLVALTVAVIGGIVAGVEPARAKPKPAQQETKAPTTRRYEVWARVLTVDGASITVDRGADEGLKVGAKSLMVHPLRQREGETSRSLDSLVVLAAAEVIEASADRATLRLRDVSDVVQVGDVVAYTVEAPAALDDDPLFRVARLGIRLVKLSPREPMYQLADRLKTPDAASAAVVLERLLEEVRARIDLADQAYKRHSIPGGKFHGLTLSDAFRKSTIADIEDFLVFVDAFPGKYIGQDWVLVEVYATWIINRTPSGLAERMERRLAPMLEEAERQCADGALDRCEATAREALRQWPKLTKAKTIVEKIETVESARRDLRLKPDDHPRRFTLMVALVNLNAWAQVIPEADSLIAANHKPTNAKFWRALALGETGKYDAAIAALQALDKEGAKGFAAYVPQWVDLFQARKKHGAKAGRAKTFADWMRDAEAHERGADYEKAQAALLGARRVAASDEEFTTIGEATRRLARHRAFASACKSLHSAVTDHEHGRMTEKIAQVTTLATALKDPAAGAKCLDDAGDKAMEVKEYDVALALGAKACALQPESAALHRYAATRAINAGRADNAAPHLDRALALDPKDATSWQRKAQMLHARGAWDEADAAAAKVAELHPNYAWTGEVRARIAAARGDWQAATRYAREALAAQPRQLYFSYLVHHALRGGAAAAGAAALDKSAMRETLRLLRTQVYLQNWRQVEVLWEKLRGTGAFDDACWAIAEATDDSAPLALRRKAADAGQPTTPRQHLLRDRIAAEADRAAATGAARETSSVRLAAHLVREGRFHEALAALGPLEHKAHATRVERSAADVATAARRGLAASAAFDEADVQRKRGAPPAELAAAFGKVRKEFEAIEAWRMATMAAWYEAFARAGQGQDEAAVAEIDALRKRAAGHLDAQGRMELDILRAGLLSWRGDITANRQALEASIATCERIDDDICAAYSRIELVGHLEGEGRLEEARRVGEAALDFARTRGMRQMTRRALFQLSDLALVRGDLPRSQELALELGKLSKEDDDSTYERMALMLQGAVASRRGEVTQALGFFADVLRLGERTGDQFAQGLARLFQGKTHLDAAHDARAALAPLEAAIGNYEAIADEYGAARARTDLGRARAALGDTAAARERLAAVLAYAERVGRKPLTAVTHVELGHVALRDKRNADALTHAERATELTAHVEEEGPRAQASHLLGLALLASGKAAEATAKLEAAARLVAAQTARSGNDAAQQGAAGFGRSRQILRDAIDALLRAGETEKALELLQLSRDAALQRTFRSLRPKVDDPNAAKALDSMQDAQAQAAATRKQLAEEAAKPSKERSEARIKALGEKMAATEARARQLLFQLRKDHPRLAALSAQVADPGALLRGRKSLPKGTVIVAYFVAESDTFVFVITRDRDNVQATRVPIGAAALRADVGAWRNAVAKRTPKSTVLGRKLYDHLLGPIADALTGADTLLLVPSGPLFYLPFGALEPPPGQLDAVGGGKARYAVERWRFSTIVAETIVGLQSRGVSRTLKSTAAFANPDGSLPGAQAEVERLAAEVLRGARVFVGAKVVADAVRSAAESVRVLHFATHGVLSGNPTDSYLQLAGGKLTLDDIIGLDLVDRVDLVVLSACQTAVAQGETAEEGFSIADTFSRAGVPTLLASLWSVPDDATAELMVAFYRALAAGKSTAAEALQTAQRSLIGKGGKGRFAHPLHWAAFGLLGDPR